MKIPACPKCGQEIASADINVAQDIAFCRGCNLGHSLAELVHGDGLDETVDVTRPPAGAWCRREMQTLVIGATHRSILGAVGALAFGLFWNGILSVFLALAVSATLVNLGIPVPEWFPAPKMNGSDMGVGMTLFLWLFLTPFIMVGVGMMGAFVSCVAGRSEVRIDSSRGTVFTGVGPIGWNRRFETASVKDVSIDDQQWRDSDGDSRRKSQIIVELNGGKKIKFGSMFSEERRSFVAAAVAKALKV